MRPLLSWRNRLDDPGVTLAVDSEVPGLGGSNLLTPQISAEVWRATYAGATRNIRVDLGVAREIGAIGLAMPRDGVQPNQHDTVRIRLGNTGVDTTDVLDTTAVSFDAAPYSTWCYPLAAGIRPNFITNPSLRDGATGWSAGGSAIPTTLVSASTVNALRDVGGGYAGRASMSAGEFMDAAFCNIPTFPGSIMEAQVRLATTAGNVVGDLAFFTAGRMFLGYETYSAVVAPRAGQWKVQASEWAARVWQGTAPASAALCDLYIRKIATGALVDPGSHWAEAAVYVADPAGTTPIFSGHYVGLNANIASLEAVAFARYVTISITSAQPYLDIGRLWIGPAFVGAQGPSQEGREIGDAGDNVRASLTGLRFPARGQPIRGMSLDWARLSEPEARRLNIAAEEAGKTGQVLAVRDVLRAREGTVIGSMTQPPAPIRTPYPQFWQATLAVQEDL